MMADDEPAGEQAKAAQAEWNKGARERECYSRNTADELTALADDLKAHPRDINGCTRLHVAALLSRFPSTDQTALIAMLNKSVVINARNLWGQTALHFCNYGDASNAFLKEFLKHSGIAVNAVDQWGLTPLHYAVLHGSQPENVISLLEAGADPRLRDMLGRTPLDIIEAESGGVTVAEARWRLRDALWWRDTDFAIRPGGDRGCGCRGAADSAHQQATDA